MPIRIPNTPATAAPTSRAKKKRTPTLGITFSMHFVKNAPENAPTHMKPAWPRLNSPRIPTVRFRETARIT